MKNIRTLLLTLTLWTSAMLTPHLAIAGAYSVNFPAGFSTFANHLGATLTATTDIDTLFGTIPDNTAVLKYNRSSGGFDAFTFSDGAWDAVPVLARGEGAFVSPGSPFLVNPSGPETPPGWLGLAPGFHLRGRQNIGKGTFESVIGSWPQDYTKRVVYRHNPSGVGTSLVGLPGFYDEFVFANGRWSPSAPLLAVGEAAFFYLNGTGTAAWPPPPSTFVVNGVSPSHGIAGTTVTLNLTGYKFSASDEVKLRQTSGSPPFITTSSYTVDPDGYVLSASFGLPLSATGYYDVQVKHPAWATVLPNAFYIQPSGASLSVKILGRSVTRPGWYDTYYLSVKNNGNVAVSSVTVSGTIPTGMAFTPIVPTPALSGNTFTVAGISLGAAGSATDEKRYAFGLTPNGSLLGQTVDIIGNILSPGAQLDEVKFPVQVVASIDPNDKFGPLGVGSEHYVTGLDPFDYLVTFENKPNASAPAQVVEITDQLDTTKLNVSTYRLGPIAFGSKVVVPPSGLQNWTGDEPYDVDGNPLTLDDNILVRISATLDNNASSPTYGLAKWTFRSLELAPPHLPVQLANIGFLPPNDTAPEGQGSVSFSVTPFSNLASGDTVQNGASIVFDNNETITTPVWVNTIDVDDPASSVDPLPATQIAASFPVSWSGPDPDSGIATYDVYVSDDNGPFTIWQTATTATSATFNGVAQHTYRFYSVATDNVGNVEEAPDDPETTPDAMTQVQLPGPALQITRVGNDVVLTWNNSAFRLETTSTTGSTAAWSPLTGNSPVTVPIGPGHQFFRLVSP
jgi:uncharacterized repeat protein (TIGR01451 family)